MELSRREDQANSWTLDILSVLTGSPRQFNHADQPAGRNSDRKMTDKKMDSCQTRGAGDIFALNVFVNPDASDKSELQISDFKFHSL